MDAVTDVKPGRVPAIRVEVDDAGIAWLAIGSRSSREWIGLKVLHALADAMEELDAPIQASELCTLVLVADSEGHHLDGYPSDEIAELEEDAVVAWSTEAQGILSRLERLPVPSIAAIEGMWVGSAAEVALACSYRVAANRPQAGIGFSHTSVDLLPAWGATVRIPRLTGANGAMRTLVRGETLGPAAARGLGIIDRIVPAQGFRTRVARYALRQARRDRGLLLSDRPICRGILEGTRGGRRSVLRRAARRDLSGPYANRQGGAMRVAFELLAHAESLSVEQAFALEAALAARVLTSAEAKGRLHAERCLASVRTPLPEVGRVIRSAAIIGSNRTASDLAALLTAAGVVVRMKDERRGLASRAVSVARERIEWERANGRILAAEAEQRSGRLTAVTGYGGFGTLDLVISAHKLADAAWTALQECQAHVAPGCALAVHTWGAMPRLADQEARPSQTISLALSLPADRFPLLEVMAGHGADARTVNTFRSLGTRLGLTAVQVARDEFSPGTRLVATYFAEASRLVDEGATVAQVDDAAEQFGFEVGPFRRMDAIGADRAYELVSAVHDLAFRTRSETDVGPTAPAHWLGRFAREARTFYNYRSGVPGQPNSLLPPGVSPDGEAMVDMIQQRLSLALTREVLLILESEREVDHALLEVIALRSLGYPPRRGGLLFQARLTGYAALVGEFEAAEARFGDRFAPPHLLRIWADSERVHPDATIGRDLDSLAV